MSAVTMASICGMLGRGRRRHSTASATSSTRRARVAPPRSTSSSTRAPGLQDRLEQLRAVGQHRLAARRAGRLLAHAPRRPEPGDDPRRIFGSLRSAGPDPLHRPVSAATAAASISLTPRRQHRARGAGAVLARAALADEPPDPRDVQPGSDLPDPGSARTAPTASTRSRRTSRSRASGTGRSASRDRSPRTWRSKSATSATAATTSGRRSTTTARINTRLHGIRGENLVANGFMNEFKLAMANLAANNASGVASRVGFVRLLRGRHGHQPAAHLPGLPQRQPGRRQPGGLRQRRHHLGELRPSPAGWRRRTRTRTRRRSISTAT